jgi:hypothetical protein
LIKASFGTAWKINRLLITVVGLNGCLHSTIAHWMLTKKRGKCSHKKKWRKYRPFWMSFPLRSPLHATNATNATKSATNATNATKSATNATDYVTFATDYVTFATNYVTFATNYVTFATNYVTLATKNFFEKLKKQHLQQIM